MTVNLTRLLSPQEYVQMQDDAVARGFYRNDRRIFTPGMAWLQPFYFDPLNQLKDMGGFRENPMCKLGDSFLSIHYWNKWAKIRAPICVVCPNGEQWEIDRKSSNGSGWDVTGEFPNITCHPSIVVHGYHGWLQNGKFTADVEGRGDIGIVRPI